METSTKVLLAGLTAFCGLSLYAKKARGSYNPLTLVGTQTSGPALPKATPAPPTAPAALPPAPPAQGSNSPEVQAAKNALSSIPASFPNSPEIAAASNVLQTAPPNSPEALAALNLLSGLPTSPEAAAALALLTQQAATAPASTRVDGHGTGVLIEDNSLIIKNGDIVNVDMFRSGMNLPQNIPLVGLIFMNVDSLESGAPDKFLASFVSPEFRVFGQQMVNRNSVVAKG